MGSNNKTLAVVGAIAFGMMGTAQASLIASYDYTDPAGKNPTTQGWTYYKNISNTYLGGIDAGTGWRTGDGTSTGYAFYQTVTGDMDAIDAAGGWQLTWTASMDSNAYKVGGDGTLGISGYYSPPNQARQNNTGIWIENAGSYLFWLTYGADASGNLTLYDGTTTHQITTGGSNGGYDVFKTFALAYDGTSSTATLTVDSSSFTIAKRAAVGTDRIIFGASTSGGQGSVLYSDVSMSSIPEPATTGLMLAAIGAAIIRRRRYG